MLTISDIHVGVQRKGGTTPKSREKLRDYLFNGFRSTLFSSEENSLLIAGDLFDEFEVDPRDWVETFNILTEWLDLGKRLYLMAGNHDWSPKGLKVSSFEVLSKVLRSIAPDRVMTVDINQWRHLGDHRLIGLAHCANQEVFDIKLEEVLVECRPGFMVVLHANFANSFAAQSDHSLNVSREVAAKFVQAGATLVFAHEHQARVAFAGKVVVMGNQWPTSIADCLSNSNKWANRINNNSEGLWINQEVMTWAADGVHGYKELDWRELAESNADFIRVSGNASSNEASEVINAISKFRLRSEALVITNAVKIEGMAEIGELPETFEAVKTFDVMEFISQYLDAAEMVVVKELAQ